MFASDRDLLVLEPTLLLQAAFAAQTVLRGAASITEGQLRFAGANLAAAGVQEGMLAMVGTAGAAISMEIVSIDSDERATVSLLRSSASEPVRPVPDVPETTSVVVTFEPQRAVVHGLVLRMLGLSAGTTPPSGPLAEDRVKNASELALLESLGSLHLIYSAASALTGPGSPAGARAEMYRERFSRERWRAEARVDTDGDGVADAVRRFNIGMLVRG